MEKQIEIILKASGLFKSVFFKYKKDNLFIFEIDGHIENFLSLQEALDFIENF